MKFREWAARFYWRHLRWRACHMYDVLCRRRVRKANPSDRWFYHLPYFIPTDDWDEDYYWISTWGCGCCVRAVGFCTVTAWSPEREAWLKAGRAEMPKHLVYPAPDGKRYLLYFDGPDRLSPYQYPDGTFEITAFKRLDSYPREDDVFAYEERTLLWAKEGCV